MLRHWWPGLTLDEFVEMSPAEQAPFLSVIAALPPIGGAVQYVARGEE